MNWKTLALKKHPGATCKREGTLYVVRDAWGRVITARRGCSNAWKQAHANKALPPPEERTKNAQVEERHDRR